MSAATRTRTPTLDAGCAEAVDLARAAALEQAGPAGVGEHLGTAADDDRVVTHRFAALAPGYLGWHWAVTVARASRAKAVTVDEVCLLPGPDALVAPPWVPWAERLRPGDLGVGDLLPAPADDPRLEPGYHGTARRSGDGDEVAEVARELGLGRPRVLSPLGIDEAADRWLNGPGGPHTLLAEAAPGRCVTCGFVVRLGGAARPGVRRLRQRVRPERRPGGQPRPRLRCALRRRRCPGGRRPARARGRRGRLRRARARVAPARR